MRDLLHSLFANFQRSWRITCDPSRRERVLKFVILMAIFMSAGPELVAALEMQILLDLLGATLFTAAFIAGAKLALLGLVESLRRHLLPTAPVALIFVAYADWWLGTIAAGMVSVHAVWKSFHWFAA